MDRDLPGLIGLPGSLADSAVLGDKWLPVRTQFPLTPFFVDNLGVAAFGGLESTAGVSYGQVFNAIQSLR